MAHKLVLLLAASVVLFGVAQGDTICQAFCDGQDASLATQITNVTSVTVQSRRITLQIAETLDMAFATLEGGSAGDEVWLDRSFDGGITYADNTKLGATTVSQGSSRVSTLLYNVDDLQVIYGVGAVRACGKIATAVDATCTEWARSQLLAQTPMEAAVTALMQFYTPDAKWQTVGWWNAANCLTAMLDYFRLTGSRNYVGLIEDNFAKNIDDWWGNYTSDALDDIAWWALAWIRAYDLTGNQTYLDMAILDAEFIVDYRDDVCGDGVWWNIYKMYKNAITNELYIKIAAQLANRIPGDTKYRNEAIELFAWFVAPGGMVNDEYLINDGLTDNCQNNRDTTWTYNQGVILGAAAELYTATGNVSYLTQARLIADAVIASAELSPNGILREPCENWNQSCNGDQTSFKGIFLRNLAELNRAIPGRPYQEYLVRQAESNYANNRNLMNQYGLHFAGPFTKAEANHQHSAVDAFVSTLP